MKAWRFLAALLSLFSQPTTIESIIWSGTSIARIGLGTSDEWARLVLIRRCVFKDSPILQITPGRAGIGASADAFWDSTDCEVVQQ